MDITNIVKAVTSTASSIGVGAVVGNAIKATSPADMTTPQKVIVGIGKFVVTGAVAALAANHIEDQVQNISDDVKKLRSTQSED